MAVSVLSFPVCRKRLKTMNPAIKIPKKAIWIFINLRLIKPAFRLKLSNVKRISSPSFVVHGIIILPKQLDAFVFFKLWVCFKVLYAFFVENIPDFFKDNGGYAPSLIIGMNTN